MPDIFIRCWGWGLHDHTVSNAAPSRQHGRPLYSQPAITDQSDTYECLFVDDGTPPGATNASTAQKEVQVPVGNAS